MTSDYDDLFAEVSRTAGAGDPTPVDDHADERRLAWERCLDELSVALQPVADAAIGNGHQASVTRLPNSTIEFEIRFSSHPDAPASCSFSGIFPPAGEALVYVDSNGPGKFDDPRGPMRRPLSRFTMETAQDYVTSVIRSASKLLP